MIFPEKMQRNISPDKIQQNMFPDEMQKITMRGQEFRENNFVRTKASLAIAHVWALQVHSHQDAFYHSSFSIQMTHLGELMSQENRIYIPVIPYRYCK